ncbi:ead/Ea22-like family protein [Escherichia coli]|uniref:ead/Ea22-like family protein n=1 Tax=Escherichia coli TaxID=562 RepID=UPI000BDF020D|nr:ead/Ea22-like family protein [Escherichia coli]
MSSIDKRELREAAEKATPGPWEYYPGNTSIEYNVDSMVEDQGSIVYVDSGDFTQKQTDLNGAFIAAANPATVLALLDERERNLQYIKRRDQENENIALTVGKLRVELEGKDSKIANLTAERDALREGEMGDARHSNTRAAADIYFQLVEECEIPAGGSLVEYVDDMREKLEAAEKRIAELEAEPVSQTCKLNEPSGNSPVIPDGWISCSERMPEKNQNVLISVNFDSDLVEPLICSVRYTGSTFLRGGVTVMPGNGIGQATHWMPLPEPPQEVNRG